MVVDAVVVSLCVNEALCASGCAVACGSAIEEELSESGSI